MSASWKAWSANHNATSQCLPPWPRSVVRSADFSPLELAGSGRGCVSAADRNSRVLLLLGRCSRHGGHGNTRPRDASERITTYQLGPHFAYLNLPPHSWAGDGLLAICFFPGLELKRELVGTHLPSALRAFLPTLAAVDDLMAIVIIASTRLRTAWDAKPRSSGRSLTVATGWWS